MSAQHPGDIVMVEPEGPTPRETYIAYLKLKVAEEDWHGVSDAANDLRELDARNTPLAGDPKHDGRIDWVEDGK